MDGTGEYYVDIVTHGERQDTMVGATVVRRVTFSGREMTIADRGDGGRYTVPPLAEVVTNRDGRVLIDCDGPIGPATLHLRPVEEGDRQVLEGFLRDVRP
jgi:hypothetical protein